MRIKIITFIILLFTPLTFAQEIFRENKDLFATKELSEKMSLSPQSNVLIKSSGALHGKINIITGEDDVIIVNYYKKAKTRSKSEAVDFIDLIAVDVNKSEKGARIEIRAPNPAPWSETDKSAFVEIEIITPEFCSIDIEAEHFDVVASGPFTSFRVKSSLGRMEVENVTEQLDLVTSNRRVEVRDVSGNIMISTKHSKLTVDNVLGTQNKLVIFNEQGEINLNNISAELSLKSSYSKIDINNFTPTGRKNYIRGMHAPILISINRFDAENFIVSNRHEDVEMEVPSDLSAVLALAVEEGSKIEVSDFPFKADLVQENRLSLVAGKGDILINGSIRGGGNIYIKGQESRED